MSENERKKKELISKVLDVDIRSILIDISTAEIDSFKLKTSEDELLAKANGERLPYQSSKVFTYAKNFCVGGNDCPDGSFPKDCTHFICHALFATNVYVTDLTHKCAKDLCTRVIELAAAFNNVESSYDNVKRITSHDATRRGDFCFVPKWFGLSKEHAMLLAGTASNQGAKVFAHTNNRCGEYVPFEGADCVYYRIEDYSE